MRVLIADEGDSLGALAAVRAIARRGWVAAVAGRDRRAMAAVSRSCTAWHPTPSAADSEYVDAVSRATRIGAYDVVLPAGDAEVLALSAGRDALDASFPYPADDVVVRSFDKLALVRAGAAAGLRVPDTAAPGDPLPATDAVIVKSRHHFVAGRDGTRREAVRVASADARRVVSDMQATGAEAVVQACIDGDLVGVVILRRPDGATVARLHQRAVSTHPCGVGVSVRAQVEDVDASLLERCDALLDALGWWGLVQLEFIGQPGEDPALVDFNGRLYGSLALAEAAGLDVTCRWAAMAADAADHGPLEPAIPARYHWLEGDLRNLAAAGWRAAPAHAVEVVRWMRGSTASTWDVRDPRPGWSHGRRLVRRVAGR